ncbi:dynein intermediate chain 3, ciliary-like [Pectinophora gossypiella]|uniref:dynein intermediate chain 3, ciliary-like n=1 Tax=Pectinophora gossypiella TaxID=13191 RepID=UPI00214E1050|nr:dynein intermediate chain 3, ciliary-like [Pectinophora gossypiella]
MDIHFQYLKKRKNFGHQTLFCEVPAHLIDSIDPSPEEYKRYILRNPVHQASQVGKNMSQCEINTIRVEYANEGANHAEGGWPKDVNCLDEEATLRYRRRIERDDCYVNAVLSTFKKFNHTIKQNNAIEMYQMYFHGMPQECAVEKYIVTNKNTFRDGGARPVSCIDWTIEEDTKMVVTYCNKTYPYEGTTVNKNLEGYVWSVENPNTPFYELRPPSACWQIACSPASPSIIVGGLEDGRVCIFDMRVQDEPTIISPFHLAHRDPVSSLIYISSRHNNEFFTGSTDGSCLWWDIRDFSVPLDSMIIATEVPPGEVLSLAHAQPVSALQYDRSFPTRFLCGTDTGLIINVNRKGKTISETMTTIFRAHNGPVKAVHRSPLTSKMFISCGDWTVHVWSDEVAVSPIITGLAHKYPITDVCWAPIRISSYMSISTDGKLRVWDLLRRYKKPIVSFLVSVNPLMKMKPHEDGRFLAVGDKKGATFLLGLSESLVLPGSQDKPVMLQSYERENRRERILENRVKEIRLKMKAEEEGELELAVIEPDDEEVYRNAEEEYKKMLAMEMANMGVVTSKINRSRVR